MCQGVRHGGPRQVALDPQQDGKFSGAFWIGLDQVQVPGIGSYSFALHANGLQLGQILHLEVKDAPHRATVILHACVQDSQGKQAGEKFLLGRIQATVIARGRSSKSVIFTVKQTVGADFAVDPMEISAPKEYADFLSLPAFRSGIEEYYRRNAIAGFGGNLDGAVDNIMMSSNLIVAPPVLLQLQLPEDSSAAW